MEPGFDVHRATLRRARLARDARFDGRFFVGVRSTGIFCRPICPAVPPAERNVVYFPTAAAAAEAGFRACLRCRPECAPGTPAWVGPSTTVARALRLIGDGALENDDVETLASRLGVGGRHLRRLFVEHLGASPVAVAQTRRLLSAKRLIDETDMPLTTIAMAAGYGSVRRFNAAFRETYGRSPRELRAGRRQGGRREAAGGRREADGGRRSEPGRYAFQLRYRPPFDWDALLAFLAPRAIPGVEEVDRGRYRRSIEIGGAEGWLEVKLGTDKAVQLDIDLPDPAHMLRVVSRVRRQFDLDADPLAIESQLAADRDLAPLLRRHPGLRVPGAWDGFEIGVRAVLGQQVSVRAATTLAGRLVTRFGRRVESPVGRVSHFFPSPEVLRRAPIAEIGVTAARAETIRRFADAVARGQIAFDGTREPADFCAELMQLPGIGPWTAQYIALRALGDPDAFPSADLGLLRATGAKTGAELAERAERWRPWRAYAALHLWTNGSLPG